MNISVLIPTHGRPEKLRRCLAGLARQTTPAAEIVVGLDGGSERDAAELRTSRECAALGSSLRVMPLPRRGYQSTRKAMLEAARSPICLSLNDDVRPDPGLVAEHLHAHRTLGSPRTPAVIAGPANWVPIDDPTLFDSVVCTTDIVFFRQSPRGTESIPAISWRQCFGLNFSFPREAALDAGGFHDLPFEYGYDDIELAHRLETRCSAQVCLAPQAIVEHDHRFTPLDVQRREYLLGRAAWAYRRVAPAFCEVVFGRDIASPEALSFAREYLQRMRRDAIRIERTMNALAECPAAPPDAPGIMLDALAEHWVLLKRYLWHWGLLDAYEGLPARFAPLVLTEREVQSRPASPITIPA